MTLWMIALILFTHVATRKEGKIPLSVMFRQYVILGMASIEAIRCLRDTLLYNG